MFVFHEISQNRIIFTCTQVESLKEMASPVYNTQKNYQHTFTPDSAKVESVKDLQGPHYAIDRDHHYAEIMKAAEKVKEIEKLFIPIIHKVFDRVVHTIFVSCS